MYDIFGKFGAIRQIRVGNTAATRGRAYVVYEDIYDAKNAVDHLSGFNVGGRYIIVLYHNQTAKLKPVDSNSKKREDIDKMKKKYGMNSNADSTPQSTRETPMRGDERTPSRSDDTPATGANDATPQSTRETPGHTPRRGRGDDVTPARAETTPARYDTTPARYDTTPARYDTTPARGTPARGRGGDEDTPARDEGRTPRRRGRDDETPARGDDETPARRDDETPARRDEDTPARRDDDD